LPGAALSASVVSVTVRSLQPSSETPAHTRPSRDIDDAGRVRPTHVDHGAPHDVRRPPIKLRTVPVEGPVRFTPSGWTTRALGVVAQRPVHVSGTVTAGLVTRSRRGGSSLTSTVCWSWDSVGMGKTFLADGLGDAAVPRSSRPWTERRSRPRRDPGVSGRTTTSRLAIRRRASRRVQERAVVWATTWPPNTLAAADQPPGRARGGRAAAAPGGAARWDPRSRARRFNPRSRAAQLRGSALGW